MSEQLGCVIVEIDREQMLDLFNRRLYPHHINVLELPDIPTDAQVVQVWDNMQRRVWWMMVTHESFDPVPIGTDAPVIRGHGDTPMIVHTFDLLEIQQTLLQAAAFIDQHQADAGDVLRAVADLNTRIERALGR